MDSEPAVVSSPSTQAEPSSLHSPRHLLLGRDKEDPFSLSGSWIALLGLAIAIATVGIPLAAVLTERPLRRESMVPTAMKLDGFKTTFPISVTRTGKSRSRDSSRK